MDEWTPFQQAKPTTEQIEEYMKSLKIEEEVGDGFYGGSEEYLQKSYNTVTKPKHYMLFEEKGIEVRDVLRILVMRMHAAEKYVPLDFPLFESDYVQLMQYLMRFMDKNGKEDLEKARWYLDKMIEVY